MNAITLSQLAEQISNQLSTPQFQSVWVKAEATQISYKNHCYMTLVESNPITKETTTQIRACLWKSKYHTLNRKIIQALGCEIPNLEGQKICVQCSVSYTGMYGISLIINDIDPTAILGDAEMKRRQTIEKLQKLGAMEWNKTLVIPRIIKNIAIISSPTAAGYIDFMNHLENNAYSYRFNASLYQSLMQGKDAPASIIEAVERIENEASKYDITVIIRGGGSKLDLEAFDDEGLALRLARHTLPLISGIGHEIDTSIVDMVASVRVKTPTHAADWIINRNREVELQIEELKKRLINSVTQQLSHKREFLTNAVHQIKISSQRIINQKRENLNSAIGRMQMGTHNTLSRKNVDLIGYQNRLTSKTKVILEREKQKIQQIEQTTLPISIKLFIERQTNRLNMISQQVKLLDPQAVLKRGYSYITANDQIVTSVKELKRGDDVQIYMQDGTTKAKITDN